MSHEIDIDAPQVVIDIETLGKRPGSVITSIGAVVCRRNYGISPNTFYTRIDPESSIRAGFRMDVDTVLWWMKQSDEARLELTQPGVHVETGLLGLAVWLEGWATSEPDTPIDGVWGNGATFDNAHLIEAYAILDKKVPWSYKQDRCYRTLRALAPKAPKPAEVGTKHNALDDAMFQAAFLLNAFDHMASNLPPF